MSPLEIAGRLTRLSLAFRLLEADIERRIHPELQNCQFLPTEGIIVTPRGEHHHVPRYTQDVAAALTLPGVDPKIRFALDMVTEWIGRQK